jgi:hypothetical protein
MIIVTYINTTLKNIYMDPRPFEFDGNIALQCQTEFGNPSGIFM